MLLDKRRKCDPERVRQLRRRGLTWGAIARRLGFSCRTVLKAAGRLGSRRTVHREGGPGFLQLLATADPAAPCTAPPGSLRKQAALAARVRAGLPLWHAGDAA